MSYKCLECGNIFEEGEQARWIETIGEFCGSSRSREMIGCPLCRGVYEKTVPCAVCGSEKLEEELNAGVCAECIDEKRKCFDFCHKISDGEKTEIKINSLLASLFDSSDIEQILKEYIHARWKDVDCSRFIDEDVSWFAEKMAEEVKNENKKVKSI